MLVTDWLDLFGDGDFLFMDSWFSDLGDKEGETRGFGRCFIFPGVDGGVICFAPSVPETTDDGNENTMHFLKYSGKNKEKNLFE